MVVVTYFKQLFSLLLGKISGFLDIIAIIAVLTGKTLGLPTWIYWVFAALSFVIANIQIYDEMDKKIKEYERPKVTAIG